MNQIKKKSKVNSITFKVEDLSSPKELLEEIDIDKFISGFSNKLVDRGTLPDNFVSYGYHSFLFGMYKAYSEHRPITLSPDIVWLIICQGISSHIKYGKGKEANIYPQLNTKDRIVVESNMQESAQNSLLNYTNLLISRLDEKLGDNIVRALDANFSTTTKHENLVFKLTVLDAFKPYFEYSKEISICGIPNITLEGTTSDWENILERLNLMRKYGLSWWIDKIHGIVSIILKTSQGNINHSFWKDMFKIHNPEGCMGGEIFDGWLSYFYPYNRKGKRNEFKKESEMTFSERVLSTPFESVCENLPNELSCLEFTHQIKNKYNEIVSTQELECWSGFLGLQQNEEFNLKPIIGWFICKKDDFVPNRNLDNNNIEENSRKYYNLKEFPNEILNFNTWFRLELNFSHEVQIPVDFKKVKVDYLKISGEVTKEIIALIKLCKDNCKVIELNGDYIKHYN